jgi:hypothetical protein
MSKAEKFIEERSKAKFLEAIKDFDPKQNSNQL